jgi:hypothetical protein
MPTTDYERSSSTEMLALEARNVDPLGHHHGFARRAGLHENDLRY